MEMPMELNKETAFRLWVAQFGKTAKATDFAGREIAKAAYNDRNSKFGWNVDHIYPQSRGGKTADYNLICCHMMTNDEKADKFPCFVSNGTRFEIQKRQNHYEIISKDSKQNAVQKDSNQNAAQQEDDLNFFDAAQGMKLWKKCQKESQDIFVGYVKIRVGLCAARDPFPEQFYNFLKKLFDTSLIFVSPYGSGINGYYVLRSSSYYEFTVVIPDLPTIQDTEDLLDNCIVLNTYATLFRDKYQRKIEICCGMKNYNSSAQMSANFISDIVKSQPQFGYSLAIDELVRRNTSAQEKLSEIPYQNFYPYDIVFTKLNKNLQKYL